MGFPKYPWVDLAGVRYSVKFQKRKKGNCTLLVVYFTPTNYY